MRDRLASIRVLQAVANLQLENGSGATRDELLAATSLGPKALRKEIAVLLEKRLLISSPRPVPVGRPVIVYALGPETDGLVDCLDAALEAAEKAAER